MEILSPGWKMKTICQIWDIVIFIVIKYIIFFKCMNIRYKYTIIYFFHIILSGEDGFYIIVVVCVIGDTWSSDVGTVSYTNGHTDCTIPQPYNGTYIQYHKQRYIVEHLVKYYLVDVLLE